MWISFVFNYLHDLRLERKKARILYKSTHNNNNGDKLSDVWRIDIISKWEDHWDSKASKPRNLVNIEKKQTSIMRLWECICAFCPFRRRKKDKTSTSTFKNNFKLNEKEQSSF